VRFVSIVLPSSDKWINEVLAEKLDTNRPSKAIPVSQYRLSPFKAGAFAISIERELSGEVRYPYT